MVKLLNDFKTERYITTKTYYIFFSSVVTILDSWEWQLVLKGMSRRLSFFNLIIIIIIIYIYTGKTLSACTEAAISQGPVLIPNAVSPGYLMQGLFSQHHQPFQNLVVFGEFILLIFPISSFTAIFYSLEILFTNNTYLFNYYRRTFWGGYAASPIIDAVDNPCRGCEEVSLPFASQQFFVHASSCQVA